MLLARAILYKVYPSFCMGRGASGWASFRTDQIELAKIAGRAAFADQAFPVNLAFLFPDRLLFILHSLTASICASIQSMLFVQNVVDYLQKLC